MLTFCCAGCAAPRHLDDGIKSYFLEYEPSAFCDYPLLPVVIGISPFSVAPAYDTNRIIYREGAFERQAYFYHRWQVNPGGLVGTLLARDMKNSGLFAGVVSPDSRIVPDYRIEGSVEEFLEWDREEQWEARLSINIVLMTEQKTAVRNRVLLQKGFSVSKPCTKRTPEALAAAMSQAMVEVSHLVIDEVHRTLSAESARRSGG